MSTQFVRISDLVRSPTAAIGRLGSSAFVPLVDGRRRLIVGRLIAPQPRPSIVESDCIGVAELQRHCHHITERCLAGGLLHIMQHGRRIADIISMDHPDMLFPAPAAKP